MEIDKNKRLFELSVDEFTELMHSILNERLNTKTESKKMHSGVEYGIPGIAKIFNCSISTANRIKASGKIDKAISQRGRLIVIDVDKALELYNKKRKRTE